MRYDEFRTGLTFRDVYAILKQEQTDAYHSGQYRFALRGKKSARRAVLGRWREIKLSMWDHYRSADEPNLLAGD